MLFSPEEGVGLFGENFFHLARLCSLRQSQSLLPALSVQRLHTSLASRGNSSLFGTSTFNSLHAIAKQTCCRRGRVCVRLYLYLYFSTGGGRTLPRTASPQTGWTSEDRTHWELVSGNFCHHDHASSGQPRYLQPFSAHRQGGYSQPPLVHQLVITLIMTYNVDLWKKEKDKYLKGVVTI